MQRNIFWVLIVALIAASCGDSQKVEKGSLTDKKARLEKLKGDKTKIDLEIKTLQEEINKSDPGAAQQAKLVSVTSLQPKPFEHYIELQGRVDADNISYITPRGAPAQVKALYIKKGDFVKKGQLIAKLDDAVQLKQVEQLKTQLSYAQDIYRRTKNLWDQGIGTEVQLKSAENNVKSLQDQISVLQEAWQMSNVRSEVNGYVEQLNLRVGETFMGFAGDRPQIVIINSSAMKVVTEVPENYLDRIRKGTPVHITLPDINLQINSSISLVSQSIGLNSRSVTTEARIPFSSDIHINQVAQVRIKDYSQSAAIVIPLTVLQTDENGKYVYVLADDKGRKVARKKAVITGQIYGEEVEIKSGLIAGEQLISAGYQDLYEGQAVRIGT